MTQSSDRPAADDLMIHPRKGCLRWLLSDGDDSCGAGSLKVILFVEGDLGLLSGALEIRTNVGEWGALLPCL